MKKTNRWSKFLPVAFSTEFTQTFASRQTTVLSWIYVSIKTLWLYMFLTYETWELRSMQHIYWQFDSELYWTASFFTELPTSRAELNAVFDAVDKKRTGKITYQQFVSALHNDHSVTQLNVLFVPIVILVSFNMVPDIGLLHLLL